MKLRNLRNWFVSSVAAGGMLAAVGCTTINNEYPGFQDHKKPDTGFVDSGPDQYIDGDAGVDSTVDSNVIDYNVDKSTDLLKTDVSDFAVDNKVLDTMNPDTNVPDQMALDAMKADASVPKPDTNVPDQMALDATPDVLALDQKVAKPDTYKAQPDMKLATPDQKVVDSKIADQAAPDYVVSDGALPDTKAADSAVYKDGTAVVFKDGATADGTQDAGAGCKNLKEMLTCLGTKYQTLVSPGWSLFVAGMNGYKGITDDPTKFKQGVAAGNPCSAPKAFTDKTCIAYLLGGAKTGYSTVELKDGQNVRVTGFTPADQDLGLEALADNKLYGKNCVITGSNLKTATIQCFPKK